MKKQGKNKEQVKESESCKKRMEEGGREWKWEKQIGRENMREKEGGRRWKRLEESIRKGDGILWKRV